ncbi:MAG TPA: hypothetical protein PLD72_05790, partial [Methanothrix soehngenii]|nr:hypothetical protein [Methanothrix soehngenii]
FSYPGEFDLARMMLLMLHGVMRENVRVYQFFRCKELKSIPKVSYQPEFGTDYALRMGDGSK